MLEKGRARKLTLLAFLGPSIIGLVLFMVLPIIVGFGVSFTEWNLISDPTFVGLDNYKTLFTSPEFYNALFNTLTFLVFYLVPVVFLGLILAVVLNAKIKGKVVFRVSFFLPVVCSWVAVSMIWMWIFNFDNGALNQILGFFGIQGLDWLNNPRTAMGAIIVTSIWKDLGYVSFILLAGLQDIDPAMYEAADLDGANSITQFFKITIPALAPKIFFVIIISSINSFQVFDQIMVMTGGGPGAGTTESVMMLIYNNSMNYYKMGLGTAMSFVLFVIILIYSTLVSKIQTKVDYYEN